GDFNISKIETKKICAMLPKSPTGKFDPVLLSFLRLRGLGCIGGVYIWKFHHKCSSSSLSSALFSISSINRISNLELLCSCLIQNLNLAGNVIALTKLKNRHLNDNTNTLIQYIDAIVHLNYHSRTDDASKAKGSDVTTECDDVTAHQSTLTGTRPTQRLDIENKPTFTCLK
uniref:Uncharacterized protein n=1 Tax=Anabas testudineus TaxID=64144 RepID=A0A3Q1ID78_ANATE